MRTTINIDDKTLEGARRYAASRAVSLSRAVQDLIEQGLEAHATLPAPPAGKLRPFRLPPGSPVVSSRRVRDLESEGA